MNFLELKQTYIIAEIGVNHEGDLDTAMRLIDEASKTGTDAVKFQTFTPQNYISIVQPERRKRAERFAISQPDFRRLAQHAKARGLDFISTPLHMDDADFLDDLVSVFKISSGDLTFWPLLRHVAAKGKPMIISTGLGTKEEIKQALGVIEDANPGCTTSGKVLLMHCVAAYPTPDEEANLANIGWLRDNFKVPVGYSDHTFGTKACELAIALGAQILEKHFTDSRENKTFHDHFISATPEELREIVDSSRRVEVFLGTRKRVRGPSELKMLKLMRRSLAAAVDIAAGTTVTEDMITYLRPAWGLTCDAIETIIGKPVNRNISAGDLFKPEDFTL